MKKNVQNKGLSLEIRNGKINFDKALENMDWDIESLEIALERFIKIQSVPFKNEFWKQYNEWKRSCTS